MAFLVELANNIFFNLTPENTTYVPPHLTARQKEEANLDIPPPPPTLEKKMSSWVDVVSGRVSGKKTRCRKRNRRRTNKRRRKSAK